MLCKSVLKMDNLTFREYAVMHLIPGEAHANGASAVSMYEEYNFRTRTFHAVVCRIRRDGSARPSPGDCRRPSSARTVNAEPRMLRTCRGEFRIQVDERVAHMAVRLGSSA
jgi:hypothetical protein